jgi:hypothetical protein
LKNKIAKNLLIILLALVPNCIYSRPVVQSTEELINNVISQSDSVFTAEVLSKRTFKNGLVFKSNPSMGADVGLWKVKITKVYRGKFYIGEIREICSFVFGQEFQINLNPGNIFTFAGVDTGKYIQLPGRFGRILSPSENEKEILAALKLPIEVSYDKEDVNIMYGEDPVLKDICYDGVPGE